jgi:hypothetical protein
VSDGTGPGDGEEPRRPVLRVVHGDASEEEVAALLAVLGAVSAEPERSTGTEPTSVWTDRRAAVRGTPFPGPGEWRASFWPR